MRKEQILIIDDEEETAFIVNSALTSKNYDVHMAFSSAQGLDVLRSTNIDLIILDQMLPDVDGLSLCKLLKNSSTANNIPIVMLTARNSSSDIIKGLSLGADDYVTKPFDLDVLIARIKNVLRRKISSKSEAPVPLTIHNIEIHPNDYSVFINKKPVILTKLEFDTLYLLASSPGRVFTRDQISENIRGTYVYTFDRSVDALIVRLRKKLNLEKDYIETVWGIGYKFRDL